MVVKTIIFGFIILLSFIGLAVTPSFAHTTEHVEQYQIEVGWGVEPPVVGFRNDVVFKVTETGDTENSYKSVTGAFRNLEATVMNGGAEKRIDINSDPRPGYYFSPIIPTKTGSYTVELEGEIDGTLINIQIPVEDVESTSILDFPPTSGSGQTENIAGLKNAISSLQQDLSKLQSGETRVASNNNNDGMAYDSAIFALSIASAAIILAIVALIKRK